jgi:adenylyltransferase/sulfurtransferase
MLSEDNLQRYRRQYILPEIGRHGQFRLARSRVLIVGIGGLGSISANYLTAAGVGYIRIVDGDVVSPDNLNRQILHATRDLGRPKVVSAAEKLRQLNPGCHIDPIYESISDDNGRTLADGCNLIVDGTDNREARYALNRIALSSGIPFIFGGIKGWNGNASIFIPGKTGCFACVFPKNRTSDPFAKSEREMIGVLGPAAGIIGSIQSMEALNILLGRKPGLAGRLLSFKGLEMKFRVTVLNENPNAHCTECGSGNK